MESLKFLDMPYQRNILHCLFDMQQTNRMCDLVLVAGNEEVHVHKIVLSAVSPYFRALLNTDFKENAENKINFQDISKSVLDTVVQFIYTGEIEITESNVYEIMPAAHIFQISLLKLPISHYLISTLDTSKCLETLAYSKLYGYDEVLNETLKFILENFHFVVTKDIFLRAPADVVKHVLCQRGPNLKSILNALGKWMKHNGSITEFHFLNKVTKENLDRISNVVIETNPEFKDILKTVVDFVKKNYIAKSRRLINHDLKEHQVLLSIGGASKGTVYPTVECYSTTWSLSLPSSPLRDEITVIPAMRLRRMCFAVAQHQDVVYALGGLGIPGKRGKCGYNKGCERYDVRKNVWESMMDMPKYLKSHAATWIDGKVVVLGGVGEDGDVSREVWEYYERDNRWRPGVPLRHPLSSHSAVNVMGTLYVLGGQSYAPGLLKSVDRFNPDLGIWSSVTEMPEEKYEFGCVAYKEYIYVIGGATKHFVLKTVHKYNTLTDTWEQCNDMPVAKSSFGCTVRDGRIFCIGGSDIVHGPLSRMEEYNPQTNRWQYTSDNLLTARSYSCAATLRTFVEDSKDSSRN